MARSPRRFTGVVIVTRNLEDLKQALEAAAGLNEREERGPKPPAPRALRLIAAPTPAA